MELVCVSDGEAACIEFNADIFHIVLLNLMIPKLSGIEVMEYIRKQSTVADNALFPVILTLISLVFALGAVCNTEKKDLTKCYKLVIFQEVLETSPVKEYNKKSKPNKPFAKAQTSLGPLFILKVGGFLFPPISL